MAQAVQRPPPAVDVIESEEIVQYIHPALLTIDYSSDKVKAITVGLTLVFFTAIFYLSLVIGKNFEAFRSLKLKHRVFMSLAVARGIFGFSTIILGSYALFKTTNLDRDVVYGRNITTALSMYFTAGFFIFELLAVVLSDIYFKTFSKMLVCHHTLALMAYGLGALFETNYCFGCKALILEMSTPFSCISFVLLKAGMENSRAWWINQLILVHTFHLRNVLECHLWYISYCNWSYIWNYMPFSSFFPLYSNMVLVTFLMTPYWGYKKTQQLFNPVDWNFEENTNTQNNMSNGDVKKEN